MSHLSETSFTSILTLSKLWPKLLTQAECRRPLPLLVCLQLQGLGAGRPPGLDEPGLSFPGPPHEYASKVFWALGIFASGLCPAHRGSLFLAEAGYSVGQLGHLLQVRILRRFYIGQAWLFTTPWPVTGELAFLQLIDGHSAIEAARVLNLQAVANMTRIA